MLTERAALNPNMQGALIRVAWAQLEPAPGKFDFTWIENQLRLLPGDKKWSLAVYAGWTSIAPEANPNEPRTGVILRRPMRMHSPEWLVSGFKVHTFEMQFRGQSVQMPKYWDPIVQERLSVLMQALAEAYNSDERLQLVYVPQMTSNGIEGHFNGVPKQTLLAAADLGADGEEAFQTLWTEAAISAIHSTAKAFHGKAVAFEVHEMLGNAVIPKMIMQSIIEDPNLTDQVGVGMWWISGKENYQPELLLALEKFSGELYGQVIGRSNQSHRFAEGDYAAVFTQARRLRMRYIEAWNYEFENQTHDDLLKGFNLFCQGRYGKQP
ncbi:hypothetical protein P0Y35_02830 [Kiritimatiellaeota bacterium B1221]|nr:hypothetical protein [Kiritimatiellaeota bacterium B1221]